MIALTVEHIKHGAHQLALETMGWDEPIPPFATRYPHILESCLAMPWQKFDNHLLYRGFAAKAAILFYLLIKNHPFQNGNKRIAVTSMFLFLYLNKQWLRVDDRDLYNVAVWVASSPPQAKDEVISFLQKYIRKHSINL